MILCTPKGIFSWNYILSGAGHSAIVELDWMREQGTITIDGKPHDVRKHGALSGHWTLEADSTTLASAQKSSAFTRSFDLTAPSGDLVLRARSALGRTMLLDGTGFHAVIAPAHPFTRRASITGQVPDFRMACFAFWLAALVWRRAAQSD